MILLQKIHISNFRKFTQPVTITGLKAGLNIIAGDNEDGKSTVLHAIKSAFFTKYNTTSTAPIQPYNTAVMPEVHVEFQRGNALCYLRKVFGKKGLAELRTPTGVFSGPDAEAKLQELCLTGGTVANKESSSMWPVLWVEQGKAFESPQIGEDGRRTLSNALESEVGKVLGGNEGHALVARVNELFSQWFTPRGQEKAGSDIKNARENLADIEKTYNECFGKYQEYEQALVKLQDVRERLKKHERDGLLDQAKLLVTQLESRLKDIMDKRHELASLDQTSKTRQLEYDTASAAFRARRELVNDLEGKQKELANLVTKLADLERQHAEISKLYATKLEASAEAQSKYEILAAAADAAERLEQFVSLQSDFTRLQTSIINAKTAETERQQKEAEGKAIKVNPAALKQLQSLEKEMLQAQMRVEAIGTRIVFSPSQGKSVTDGAGHQLEANKPLLITENSEFNLDGWGSLTVTPGGEDLATIRQKAVQLKADLTQALAAHGVQSIDEAVAAERKQAELRAEYVALTASLKLHAPSGIPALESELARLEAKSKDVLAADAQLQMASELQSITAEEAKKRLLDARKSRDESAQSAKAASAAASQAEREVRQIDTAQQTLVAQKTALEQQTLNCVQKLASARTTASDELLEQRMTEAKVLLENVVKEKSGLQDQLKLLNADTIELESNAARQKVQDLQAEITQLNYDQRELQGSLQTFGNTGITEELQRLKGKLEQAQTSVERTEKKSRAIKLLYNTISAAEANAKKELSAPLMKHLEPFVSQVFDGGKLAFNNQDFSITHMHRDGIPEEYGKLSLGTREQLSVLTRLAFARLLTESGTPALVILDDALVYSDQDRLDRMQQILKDTSSEFQILILTCRQRDYEHLEANLVRLDDCMTTAATSQPAFVVSALTSAAQTNAPAEFALGSKASGL